MQQRYKLILSTALIASVGIAVFLVVKKYKNNILEKLRRILDYKNPLRHLHIEVCTNLSESRKIADSLQLHCSKYPVLGFDCEWSTGRGSIEDRKGIMRTPVALLQLATQNGLCALIRLCTLETVPPEIRSILEDENIIKVGVETWQDVEYLAADYGVQVASTIDLRYLAQSPGYIPRGLASLSEDHLNIKMNKDLQIILSDWEADPLTDEQISYAATNAFVAIELFKVFYKKSNLRLSYRNKMKIETYIDSCRKYVNLRFNRSQISTSTKEINQKSKRLFSTFNKELSECCYLLKPDGDLLTTASRRKAEWYVSKSLGVVVKESPYTVKLNIESNVKRCVVCGASGLFTRKPIIPREYTKYLTQDIKIQFSREVVLLCPECFDLSHNSDMNVRLKLAESCDAPLRYDLKKRKSYAKTLYLQGDSLSIERKEFLQSQLLKVFPPGTVLTEELLKNSMEMNKHKEAKPYVTHGFKVVDHMTKSNKLIELQNMWREHFVRTMNPKYLPTYMLVQWADLIDNIHALSQ